MASSAAADRAKEEQSGEIPAEFVYNQDAASPEGALGTKQEAQERASERARAGAAMPPDGRRR